MTRKPWPVVALGGAILGFILGSILRDDEEKKQSPSETPWLRWRIKFSDQPDAKERAKFINQLEKHVLDHLYK